MVPLRYSAGNITTILMLVATACMFVARFRIQNDNNWPLALYGALFAYQQHFTGIIHPNTLYAGIVSALMIRFEFMGGKSGFLFRAVELLALSLIIQELYNAAIF